MGDNAPGWAICASYAAAVASVLLATRARAGKESDLIKTLTKSEEKPVATPSPVQIREDLKSHDADADADAGADAGADADANAVTDADTDARPAARAAHEKAIPADLVVKIPTREQLVLRFFLEYIAWSKIPVDGVFINGGYVRDLLLDKEPDDLDLSICLVDCAEDVTVGSILEDMPNFIDTLGAEMVKSRFGFDTFKSVDIQGDVSKDKNLDTAKAVFGYADGSPPLDVDVMPTIGEETYDENDTHRIPTRDQRGTPLQDALRRDLTIGAMLVKVKEGADGTLTWTLLDYYGGLEDLKAGVLRAPHPPKADAKLILSDADRELAKVVGMDVNSPQDIWWVKVLRDDPLRIVRVFRFAAKLDFRIHETFWKVLPFALDNLKAKVAGSRKLTEILKLAKYGNAKIIGLFKLCFRKRFVHDLEGSETCLATGIFGGQDASAVAHYLPPIETFDKDRFIRVVEAAMPDTASLSHDEAIGNFLAVALYATRFKDHEKWEADNLAAGGLSVPEEAFERACNGLSTSNDLRAAGMRLLTSYERLRTITDEAKCPSSPEDSLFGKRLTAATADKAGEHASLDLAFTRLRAVWETLALDKEPEHFAHELVVSMLEHGSAPTQRAAPLVKAYLAALREAPPTQISGKGISGVAEVPPHLRGGLLTRLRILCRMRGETGNLDAPGALHTYLESSCDGLLTDLVAEWHDAETGQLKSAYQAGAVRKKANKSKKKGGKKNKG
ncbi:CCA tRNA nucleotidyltransferase, mitochondrial [Hondaea fermentalgiana]|uniref:CCA tRNA nucleotidyltransferase, mitochondrial n=1 Tax=Hondaea fermentalgiana TaxID=2315210 RepID=A0A2R5G7S0_9STRA|nr:CCA tRNA nucleotidyltransferase, mitochondrial [Hondaea fermentalgiana]|eukprot:GBG24081.1 CCA tRNA nucleotidyltransferase, mitochondrial [Hondaea fermentalgiana]